MTDRPLASFAAAEQLWDAAIESGGLRYQVQSYGEAVSIRHACYRYRKKLEEQLKESLAGIPNADYSLPHSPFTLTIFDGGGNNVGNRKPKGAPENPPYVVIFARQVLTGVLTKLDGTPVTSKSPAEISPLDLD